jgi:hypothetical protein
MRLFLLVFLPFFLISCGGGSSSNETPVPDPEPTPLPLISFSISDAPSDSVTSVNVTFNSITLKSTGDDDEDDSGLEIPILDDSGNPSAMTIDLMEYQNGEKKLIIDNVQIASGEYKNLVLNTSGCPQNQNGSTEFCWVVDSEGIKTLKTPSNKLKLGAFTITSETEQSYTIEFNLRSSLTATANSSSYNLKPHGIRIVNGNEVGSLLGSVDANLLTIADGCEAIYQEDSDHGKIVYLYQGELAVEAIMGDEFDSEEAQNTIPENVVMPYASDSLTFDSDDASYNYGFSHLPAGVYTVAFSCSAIEDDSEEYDSIKIANPENQQHNIIIEANVELIQNFTES